MGRLLILRTQYLLYCKIFLVTALLGAAYGHPDLRTSHHPTFYGDFSRKESIQTVHELKHTTEYTAARTDP
jgi:hypothetical protein